MCTAMSSSSAGCQCPYGLSDLSSHYLFGCPRPGFTRLSGTVAGLCLPCRAAPRSWPERHRQRCSNCDPGTADRTDAR